MPEKAITEADLSPCPVCGRRCIHWVKNMKSHVIVCTKCRYHMGPYTRRSDAKRAHERQSSCGHCR